MLNNLEYIYEHLPSRFRRDDKDLFLKRYLQFFGDTLDEYDDKFDRFFENIEPDTATEKWIEFWLRELFGWSWFPKWFTLAEKRRLYRNFARHLARRGTAKGIEEWLADFTIVARVYTRPAFWGDFAWGENVFTTPEPLLIAVEVLFVEPRGMKEMSAFGETAWGEAVYNRNEPLFTNAEFVALLRYVQPHAQEILSMRTDWKLNVPKLFGYTIPNNFQPLRTLDGNAGDLDAQLWDFLATFATDLSEGSVLTGYLLSNYIPLRTLNPATIELDDVINFTCTMVADYLAGNSFDNYIIPNISQLRTVNRKNRELAAAAHIAMTIALDLGATITP